MKKTLRTPLLVSAAGLGCVAAQAGTGKLLLTGGACTVDGAAGGGLTPRAVTGPNATEGEMWTWGASCRALLASVRRLVTTSRPNSRFDSVLIPNIERERL